VNPSPFEIANRLIGPGHPTYVIAEISANHHQSFEKFERLITAAIDAGADAIKLQTYTPDTITLDCDAPDFRLGSGTIWDGNTLHALYGQAYTPWEWHKPAKRLCESRNVPMFSSPFDHSSVDFLENIGVPAYKIASFELVDLPLIRKCAGTGMPLIMSTGMASLAEIDEAVAAARGAGATQIALLKTNSGYPAPPSEMNLRTIAHLAAAFGVPAGLSDHTLGFAVPVAAVALGACIVEKHICLDRNDPGPDSAFSLEPAEFKAMVDAIRIAEQAVGEITYAVTPKQATSRPYRRSLYVVRDVAAGEPFTHENVRSIRPGFGLHTRYFEQVLGRVAKCDIARGTALKWDLIG
jgi:N-acetylneuraminate synthase